MSTGTFVQGYTCPFKGTPAGGSEQTYQVKEHSWAETVDKFDITHTGSGGVQGLLAGIARGTVTFKASFDASSKYYDATRAIRAGVNFVVKHYVSSALFYTIPIMITTVNSVSAVAGEVTYDCTGEVNSEAGSFSYPS